MSRRIDIELTSVREDQTWTWRAAGAKQPKGVVAASRLPADAAVGDVLRAEVETTLDGTDVLSVTPPKAKREVTDRIELIGRSVPDDQLVTTTLAPKRGGNRRDRGDRDGRGERRGRGDRADRGDRDDRRRDGDGRNRRDGGGRPDGDRRGRGEGGERNRRPERPAPPARPKPKRLRPARTHRKAALDVLAPEEQVIAEQLLRGGLPAVRQAVEKQNEQAKAEGRPIVKADALLAVAERLYPALRVAEWRDRAEAAVADMDELDLRDLRSVVVAAESGARDDESRALAEQIREGLARRVDAEQSAWLTEITETLDTGRVVRALRLSSRPPKAGAPLPADVAAKLTESTSAALTADTLPDRWATVLDALSFSPVRLQVKPASKPETPSEELVAVVTRVASRLPNIAQEFGITPPPESAKRRGPRGGNRGRGGAPKGGGATAPRPPKPAIEPAPADPPEQPGSVDQDAPVEAPAAPDTTPSEAPTGPTAEAEAVPAGGAPSSDAATTEADDSSTAAARRDDASGEPAEAPSGASALEP